MDHDDEVRYQNELIHQRLTWLGTFEGLLFVANHYATDHPHLLPLVGFALGVSVGVGTSGANRRLTELKAQAFPDCRNYLMPGTAIPVIIAVTWAAIWLESYKCFSR